MSTLNACNTTAKTHERSALDSQHNPEELASCRRFPPQTVTVLCIAERGNVRTHHAERGRGLRPANTPRSPGARRATAVRSGLWRHAADAHAFLTIERLRGGRRDQEESTRLSRGGNEKVCPHAGAISSSHQHVVDEEVSARYAADELARYAIVVVAQVGDHVVKLEDLVALVGVLKPRVEGHPRDRAVGGPDGPGGPGSPGGPGGPGLPGLPGFPCGPCSKVEGGSTLLRSLNASASAWSPVELVLLAGVGVAHHATGAQHLVVAGVVTHGADQHGDEDHQHQDQHNPDGSRHQGLPPDAESGKGLRCQRGSPGGRNGDCLVWGACHRRSGSRDPGKSCKRTGECVRGDDVHRSPPDHHQRPSPVSSLDRFRNADNHGPKFSPGLK
ncbi:hypothetical protein EYF80_032966 [Liparis tanakae]|uniref:Uncharacterized protein n=1 Tax=Liparis tanakae TaxID=230148 RepID=A0A4Z2GSY8_9TELE|nr:hypothetical protein EYF80_032966 [Liparis tanakae]